MHGDSSNLDSRSAEYKQLLALEEESSLETIDKEDFVRDFKEINEILKDLNEEVCSYEF